MVHLKVTTSPTLKERDEWGGALFHFHPSLNAYGDVSKYDLSSVVGLLKLVIDFVNRPQPKLSYAQIQAGGVQMPRGRDGLRQLLHAAVHGGNPDLANPSQEFLEKIREQASNIHWMHRLERASGGVEWRHHASISDAEAFHTLIASLLMSQENRALLAQCRHCGKFFVVQAPLKGRPQTRYDTEDCRKAANDAGAGARQIARRARLAAMNILRGGKASRTTMAAAVKQAQLAHPDATAEDIARHAKEIMRKKK
jgi:hypothetical protein